VGEGVGVRSKMVDPRGAKKHGPVHKVSIAAVAGPTTIIRTTVQAMTL